MKGYLRGYRLRRERRMRIARIPTAAIAPIFQGRVSIVSDEIPADAIVEEYVSFDALQLSFTVYLLHESFESVRHCEEIPEIGGRVGLMVRSEPDPEPRPHMPYDA